MALLDTLKNKLGVRGPKKYDSTTKTPPFAGMSLREKLQALVLHYRTANREERIRRHQTYYLMALYYHGFQQVELNANGSSFDVYERENYYVENQFRPKVDTVVQMLNKMEGDVLVRPASDTPQDIATARVADPILELMLDTIGYEKMRDLKNLYKALFGTTFVFTDYVVDKKYGTTVTPKFSYSEEPGPDGEPILSKVPDGYDTRNKGQEVAAVCSPLEINCLPDIKDGLTALPWLQWISRQDIDIINHLYPGLNEGETSSASEDLASTYMDVLGNLSGNVLGNSVYSSESKNKCELVRSWLQPCTFQNDTELKNAFKDGVHVTTVNGRVVDWYPENLIDRWTYEVLIPAPHSMMGDGLNDAISPQDQLNELDSLFIQHCRYTTVGHKIYDVNIIDPKDVVNDPKNGWIPGRPSLDKNISQAAFDLSPNQLSQDVGAWRGAQLQTLQDVTGAFDPVTGKGLGANTPYSQSVFLAERAQSRWQGSLSYNRPELIRFHRQLLAIAKDNWHDMRTRAIADNTGQWSFQQFSQSDIQGQVDIRLSNTDFKPRSRAEQIQGLQMLLSLAPILPGMPPRQKLRIEEMLGLPSDANPMNNQISRAMRNIDRLKKKQVVTPLAMVDQAQAQLPVFQDFLVSEDGEALAEQDPETYANIYTFMMTLMMMGMSEMMSPAGQMMAQQQQPQPPGGAGSPPGEPKKEPGGQLGQKGGGPQTAQTVQPQQPISPGSATATTGM